MTTETGSAVPVSIAGGARSGSWLMTLVTVPPRHHFRRAGDAVLCGRTSPVRGLSSQARVLQHFRDQRGDLRALGPDQRDVREQRVALEFLDHRHDPVMAADPQVVPL